ALLRAPGARRHPAAAGAVRSIQKALRVMMNVAIAALVFVGIVATIVGLSWARAAGERVRLRLGRSATPNVLEHQLLRSDAAVPASAIEKLARCSDLVSRLTALSAQAGTRQSATDLLLVIVAFGLVGAVLGWWRIGNYGGAVLAGLVPGPAPPVWGGVLTGARVRP